MYGHIEELASMRNKKSVAPYLGTSRLETGVTIALDEVVDEDLTELLELELLELLLNFTLDELAVELLVLLLNFTLDDPAADELAIDELASDFTLLALLEVGLTAEGELGAEVIELALTVALLEVGLTEEGELGAEVGELALTELELELLFAVVSDEVVAPPTS
ncbi:hypothetical protein HDU86_004534 [Geranomyces michiganensis]|nr:hypothetical protein HDU86_004534 [Geranomyces michiganensis]